MAEDNRSDNQSPDEVLEVYVDLNEAEVEDLARIPGVGQELARRILDARPYEQVEDLRKVSGIGPSTLENMRPYVRVPSSTDEDLLPVEVEPDEQPGVRDEEVSEGVVRATEVLEEDEEGVELLPEPEGEELVDEEDVPTEDLLPVEVEPDEAPGMEDEEVSEKVVRATEVLDQDDELEKLPPPAPEEAPEEARPLTAPPDRFPNMVTRAQALWLALGAGLLSFLLSLAVALGILAAINGSLRFATPQDVREISRQVSGINDQVGTVQGDLDGLRVRLDNLETIGGRVVELEELAAGLEADLSQTESDLETLANQSETLASEVDSLQEESDSVMGFLEGMRTLLDDLFGPETTPESTQ